MTKDDKLLKRIRSSRELLRAISAAQDDYDVRLRELAAMAETPKPDTKQGKPTPRREEA